MARILCVEDDADLLKLYSKVIRGFGHDVLAASNVPDGMKHIEAQHLEMLITDWSLGNDDAAPLIHGSVRYPRHVSRTAARRPPYLVELRGFEPLTFSLRESRLHASSDLETSRRNPL